MERGRHIPGFLHRSGVLPDELVPRSVRGRFPGVALGDLSTPHSTITAPVRDRAGSTRQRTDTNRTGTARYAAAKLSGTDSPLSSCYEPAPGAPGRSQTTIRERY